MKKFSYDGFPTKHTPLEVSGSGDVIITMLPSSGYVLRGMRLILVVWWLVVCSEENAKKRIYNVSCERYFGFRCEIEEETYNKLEVHVSEGNKDLFTWRTAWTKD